MTSFAPWTRAIHSTKQRLILDNQHNIFRKTTFNHFTHTNKIFQTNPLSTSAWRSNQKQPLPLVGAGQGGAKKQTNKTPREISRRPRNDNLERNSEKTEQRYIIKDLVTRVLSVDSVRKTTAGGRINRFRAIVAAGNGNGAGGFGFGKAPTVRAAVAKAVEHAKKQWVTVGLREDGGLYHDVMGKFNNTRVLLRSCKPYNGLTAGGIVRGICNVFGIENSTTKVIGRTTPSSVVYATLHALSQHQTPTEVQEIRGKKLFRSEEWIL